MTDPASLPAQFGSSFYGGTDYAQGRTPAVYGQAVYGASIYDNVRPGLRLRLWRIRPLPSAWEITRTP